MAVIIGQPLPLTGNILVQCIAPDHDDTEASMSVSPEALYHCHACGASGDVITAAALVHHLDAHADFARVTAICRQLAHQAGEIPTADAAAPALPKNKNKDVVRATGSDRVKVEAAAHRYLIDERGIDAELVQALRLDPLLIGGVPAIGFVACSADTASLIRIARVLGPLTSKSARYRMLEGDTSSSLVQLCAPFDGDGVGLITEGLIDALTALDAGTYAVSLAGGAANLKKLGPALRALAQRLSTVIIATDGDEAGHKAADELARGLYAGGARDLRRIDYPPGSKDLNEVGLKFGRGRVCELIAAARPFLPAVAPEHWLDPVDALTKEPPPREYIVFDTIQVGHRVIVAGRGDTGKSLLTADLAVAVAEGLGSFFAGGEILTTPKVVIINEEMDPDDVRRRLRALAVGRGVPPEVLAERVRVGHHTGITLTGPGFAKLEQLCREEPALLIIIDSLRPLLGEVNEIDNGATLRALNKITALQQLGKHTFVIIAHESKGPRERAAWQTLAGSGAIFNWADTVLRVERKNREEKSILSFSKGRHRKAQEAEGARDGAQSFEIIDRDGGLVVEWSAYAPKKKSAAPAAAFTDDEVEAVLTTEPVNRKSIFAALGVPVPRPADYAAMDGVLARLTESGVSIRVLVRGTPYWGLSRGSV